MGSIYRMPMRPDDQSADQPWLALTPFSGHGVRAKDHASVST